jgi:hypothetical protein
MNVISYLMLFGFASITFPSAFAQSFASDDRHIEIHLVEPYCKACLYSLDHALSKHNDMHGPIILVIAGYSYDSLNRVLLGNQLISTLKLDYEIIFNELKYAPSLNLTETPEIVFMDSATGASSKFGYYDGSKRMERKLHRWLRRINHLIDVHI